MTLAIPADNLWAFAAVWLALATAAAFLARRVGLAAALVEILLGVLAGNLIGLRSNAWVDFIAGFGSIMLTFLAGAEIEPTVLRRQLRPAAVIGAISFFAPFLAAMAYAFFVGHWSIDGSKIAGIAMSTTSVAVVYAVMVESRLAGNDFGQLILAACFITDLGTVVALGLLFANYNAWLIALIVAIIVAMALVPKFLPALFERTGRWVSEPGLRLIFLIILGLSAIATAAKSEGVLPAYFLGLACAGFLFSNPDVSRRLRSMTMGFLTPFYFLKAGTLVSFSAAIAGVGAIVAFFLVKVIAKCLGVFPAARAFRHTPKNAGYITLMMATGLTFGTISSLYGLTHHYIDEAQYTTLVTVVILTAIVPTVIAQTFFHPSEFVDPEGVGVP
ncbi:MAG: cation:proton antiporter [Candidatus Velthaea sp.]